MAYANYIRYGKKLMNLDNPHPRFKMYILNTVQRLDGYGLIHFEFNLRYSPFIGLSQFQAKESTEINEEIINLIKAEIKKQRIVNVEYLEPEKFKKILKNLNLNDYYEHIPYIKSLITGKPAPTIPRETEEMLKKMFEQIQIPFERHCPSNRVNFLSYSYVLHKLCQLLELDDIIKCFPLLKSRTKLRVQDQVWKKICQDLKWQFYPSV